MKSRRRKLFAENYAKYYELFNSDKPYKKEIEFIYKWAGNPQWIFDIGCGSGSYWKFYPKDTNIYGIEKSKKMAGKNSRINCVDITKYKHFGRFDCATALFDVLNYIPKHDWWQNIPLDPGGFFIFDIWNKEKVDKEGFKRTVKSVGKITRTITPLVHDGKEVHLEVVIDSDKINFREIHVMYVWSDEDIARFCGKDFTIVDTKETEKWQKWYKLRKE